MHPRASVQRYPTFDHATTLDRVDGDWHFLLELVDLFLQDNPRLMRSLSEALARGDRTGIATLAHTLKGAASNFDAHDVVQCARRLEQLAREEPHSPLDEAWQELQRAIAALREDMTRFLEEARSEPAD